MADGYVAFSGLRVGESPSKGAEDEEERAKRLGERKIRVAQSGLFSETILFIHAGLMILMRRGTEAANRGRL